ncbi:PAS domain S-box protein [Patescibacteria group bacterium]|nr:PAS domain S-box protein [Patescibacteria group bacterium]MBU4580665.1 PAS domain S-box protein [Patescibacteria group bacterium]
MRLNLFLKLFLPIATAFIIFAIVIFLAVSGDIKNGNIGREQMAQIIFGGLFLLLTALALFLDFFVANPVNKIKEAIDKIRQGDFKQRIKISSGDAIGYLGRIFNEMMDNVQKSDEKIKEERRELQAILFSMGEGLLVLDRDLNILLINTTAEKLLGVPAKDAVGKQIKKVLALLKGDRELPMEEWPARRMLKSGKSVTVVIKDNIYYKTVSGRVFPVEISTAPFVREGIIGAIVVFRDVSNLKTAEEDREFARINMENALKSVYIERDIAQEQKNKLEAILNSIGDAVFAIDQEKKIIIFNSAAEALTGFKFSKVRGSVYNKYLKFSDEITKSEKTKHIDRALRGEVISADRHFVLTTKKGNLIDVEERITPIKNQQGEIMGCIVVFRDITAKRKLEMMRSDFISIASHQLRTPLSATKWFLEILVNGDVGALKKKQLEVVREAYVNNQSMINLVNTMLNMSRIESKQLIINLEKINIEDTVKKILSELKPLLDKKDQKIKFFGLKDKKLEMETDKVLLKNVIDNLVINSSKYSPGGKDIIIRIAKKDSELLFSVADKGIGISKIEQYKIFKKFSRTNNAVAYNASGTGLGLYIVKSILDVFGGKIWFKSEENKGAVFYFSLPIKKGYCKI